MVSATPCTTPRDRLRPATVVYAPALVPRRTLVDGGHRGLERLGDQGQQQLEQGTLGLVGTESGVEAQDGPRSRVAHRHDLRQSSLAQRVVERAIHRIDGERAAAPGHVVRATTARELDQTLDLIGLGVGLENQRPIDLVVIGERLDGVAGGSPGDGGPVRGDPAELTLDRGDEQGRLAAEPPQHGLHGDIGGGDVFEPDLAVGQGREPLALTGCVLSPEAKYSAVARQAVAERADLGPDAVEQAVVQRAVEAEAAIWRL